jgi:hypothetical protein
VVIALLGLPAAWLAVPGFGEWLEHLFAPMITLTGDDVIDRQIRRLEELRKTSAQPTESQLAEALAPLFTRPAFYEIREEDWHSFLYVLCRTRLLLEEYEERFKSSIVVRGHIDNAIKLMVALENRVAAIYGPNFSVTEQIRRYGGNKEKFLAELPRIVKDPAPEFFDERDRDIAAIRAELHDAGIVDAPSPPVSLPRAKPSEPAVQPEPAVQAGERIVHFTFHTSGCMIVLEAPAQFVGSANVSWSPPKSLAPVVRQDQTRLALEVPEGNTTFLAVKVKSMLRVVQGEIRNIAESAQRNPDGRLKTVTVKIDEAGIFFESINPAGPISFTVPLGN